MMNTHKLHIRYNRALTQVLVKYMQRDQLSAARNEIAQVILEQIVGEDWVPPDDVGEDNWEDFLDEYGLNDFRATQRAVITGEEPYWGTQDKAHQAE